MKKYPSDQSSEALIPISIRRSGVNYIVLTWEMFKRSVLSAMEYRLTFFMQVIGMVANDTGLVLLWVIFFQKFPSVNGWQFQDTALLFALSTVIFALIMMFARGSYELARTISRGELDYFLGFPKNVLWHVSMSKTEISAIGDLLFGIIIYFFAGQFDPARALLFVVVGVIASFAFYNFIIITQSIGFFVGNFEEGAEQLFEAVLGFTLYPQSVFYGFLKIVMFTVIPAFFIITIPVRILQQFRWEHVLWLLLFAIFSHIFARWIFNRGLKRYESGNLINVRV